jgi:hypothetical protein
MQNDHPGELTLDEKSSNPIPISREVDQQIAQLGRVTDQIRGILQRSGLSEPIQGLNQLISHMTRLSRQMARYEAEYYNLQALADIGQVVNSSLELNEVLRIVMDTIVRLTGAERGFLMLREDGSAQGRD